MSIQIDFIAGHPLQAQAAASVFEALKDRAECRWLIGRPSKPTGARAAVFVDHIHHHPDFAAWPARFYMLHDLGDVDVYTKERDALRQFTAVIVPDERHAVPARQSLAPGWYRPGATIIVGGWPKYDEAQLPINNQELLAEINSLPDQPTLLYAISWAGEDEWKTLLPALGKLPINVIIKNHSYATAPGDKVSDYYVYSRKAVKAMEELARQQQYVVAPASLNICQLFPHVDAIISDQSSVLAEFLPWGLSIETGANAKSKPRAEISKLYTDIVFWPLPELVADIQRGGEQLLAKIASRRKIGIKDSHAGQDIAEMIWKKICN